MFVISDVGFHGGKMLLITSIFYCICSWKSQSNSVRTSQQMLKLAWSKQIATYPLTFLWTILDWVKCIIMWSIPLSNIIPQDIKWLQHTVKANS